MIPNNIGLESDRRLSNQLAAYRTKFRQWWHNRGPNEFLHHTMRLRVPTGHASSSKWSDYTLIRPSEYNWGVFAIPSTEETIVFGDHRGKRLWAEVPSDYRRLLFDHIRIQADVENASVEQSRSLTRTVPSHADLENVFQFYLEEARHTWSMVHLLVAYFGQDGTDEAEAILERLSGDPKSPRLLDAFNHQTEDWLSHFIWCFLADRVGKYQIQAVTRSAFAPLAGAARFMMLEEPLHISFGALGLERILLRSAEATIDAKTEDVFFAGAIPLPVIQKYINYWMPKIYDLFGSDTSNRSRQLFAAGIRSPRNMPCESEAMITIDSLQNGRLIPVEVTADRATNVIMRRQFISEISRVVVRWNQALKSRGLNFEIKIPDERYRRRHGPYAERHFSVTGKQIDQDASTLPGNDLPSARDIENMKSLMMREIREDQCASWLAPVGHRFKTHQT